MLHSCWNKISLTAVGARLGLALAAAAAVAVGCSTAPMPSSPPPARRPVVMAPPAGGTNAASTNDNRTLVMEEGDTLRVTFPGAPNMDTIQAIRHDGKITLDMVGEYVAAGKTPTGIETELRKLYAAQLVNNEVKVSVQSSAWVIYVMGALGRPGKLVSAKPLTLMQALIESGIDDTRSNLKSIYILRTDGSGHTAKYKLNIYNVLHKQDAQMPDFTLEPYDIIRVPERFSFY